MFNVSYALIYYFATLLVGGAVSLSLVFLIPSFVGFERALVGDTISLFLTVAAMLSGAFRRRVEEELARIAVKVKWEEQNAEKLAGGPWLKLGACFCLFYAFFIMLHLRSIETPV